MKSREMERIMSTLDISTMSKGELVEEIDRQLACAKCRGSGTIQQPCTCIKIDGNQPSDRRYHRSHCDAGGVKYCACNFGAERYQHDLTRTDVIIAPITREWHLFPKDQYGTPEFLQMCIDQAAEARKVGRLACASALDRYVERESRSHFTIPYIEGSATISRTPAQSKPD